MQHTQQVSNLHWQNIGHTQETEVGNMRLGAEIEQEWGSLLGLGGREGGEDMLETEGKHALLVLYPQKDTFLNTCQKSISVFLSKTTFSNKTNKYSHTSGFLKRLHWHSYIGRGSHIQSKQLHSIQTNILFTELSALPYHATLDTPHTFAKHPVKPVQLQNH